MHPAVVPVVSLLLVRLVLVHLVAVAANLIVGRYRPEDIEMYQFDNGFANELGDSVAGGLVTLLPLAVDLPVPVCLLFVSLGHLLPQERETYIGVLENELTFSVFFINEVLLISIK